MDTFFLQFISSISFPVQPKTSFNILPCCVFKIKIKLLNFLLDISDEKGTYDKTTVVHVSPAFVSL